MINTALDVGIYSALSLIGVPLLLANFFSTLAGLSFSFAANRRFTFGRLGRPRAGEIAAFVLVTGCGLWVIQPLILIGCDQLLMNTVPALILVVLGKLIAVVVGVGWNWFWYSRVLFKVDAARLNVDVMTARVAPITEGGAC